ncbi:MAG: hypothetical protein GEV11_29830 [Streptosporangiales bacterium]|nr:hypothetical protein [Streptosporangiales bacterium]
MTTTVTGTPSRLPRQRGTRHRDPWPLSRGEAAAVRRPALALLACVVWAAGTAVALFLVARADMDPFHLRGQLAPMIGGAAVLGLVLTAALTLDAGRRRFARLGATVDWLGGYAEVVCAVAASLFAAWIALLLAAALNGTPHGFDGLRGDTVRIAALALRMAESPVSRDAITGTVPSEYPLLYPLLIGWASDLTGSPVWMLMGRAEIIGTSFAVVAGYLIWRRLVPPLPALTIASAVVAVFALVDTPMAHKPYETITLALLAPWVIATFCDPPRGRLSWWASGLIGGLMVAMYQGFLIHSVFALVALLVWSIRRAADRRAAVLRYAGVAVVAFAVSAFYTVPFLWASLTGDGGQRVSDLYVSGRLLQSWVPFWEMTPIGLLQLLGLIAVVVYFRSTWWAGPLAFLVAGAYLYRLLGATSFLLTGHTMFAHRAMDVVELALATAGVLAVARFGPHVATRLFGTPIASRPSGVALVVALVGFIGWASLGIMPSSPASGPRGYDLAFRAHVERLPDGTAPRYAPVERSPFPSAAIISAIRSRLGERANPVTLSYSERLYAYAPFPAYLPQNRTSANTLIRWDDRLGELRRLARVPGPAAFAVRSQATAFGGIDVFILQEDRGRWWFTHGEEFGVGFRPGLFDSPAFEVIRLPNSTVVAMRTG